MRVQKEAAGSFRLTLNLFEGRLLRQCLASIGKNYLIPPDQADPQLLASWYSAHGCEAAGRDAAEIAEWQQSLHELRTENLQRVERWQLQLRRAAHGRYQLTLSADETPAFLSVINDHRLLIAAQQTIGEVEMSFQSLRRISQLSAERQAALYEIHLLAYLMEELLALLME